MMNLAVVCSFCKVAPKFFLLVAVAAAVGCVSKPGHDDSKRFPSSIGGDLKTRDGTVFKIPELRQTLDIPECVADDSGPIGSTHDECIPEGESDLLDNVTRTALTFQTAQNPATVKVSQRDFHAKQNACVAAVWTPLSNLPEDLNIGAFALSWPVKAVVRLSNGSPKSPAGDDKLQPDVHPEPRGLAIKLVDIPGDSILNIEDAQAGKTTQDFVLINFPTFFLHSPKNYPDFLSRITVGKPFFDILDGDERKALIGATTTVPDVVMQRYFSQVPYKIGKKYAKYQVRPCQEAPVDPISDSEKNNPNFLRKRIQARLGKGPICLIFSVQIKAPEMIVEDAVAEWRPDSAPFMDVAKIDIPANQDITDPVRDSYCENISFNPWNSLPENRPAGAISRARLAVYSALSRKRRTENRVQIREPKATESFFDVLK